MKILVMAIFMIIVIITIVSINILLTWCRIKTIKMQYDMCE